jgi:stage V sporulation protein D (sporulation-specific penicillin-binding protein)
LEDPEIAIIIIVDEPSAGNVYGSVVAAPYVSKCLAEIFPYMGFEPSYSDDEEMITIRSYTGMTVDEVKEKLDKSVNIVVKGDGNEVIGQVPGAASKLYSNGTLVLYTEGAKEDGDMTTVPNLVGKTASEVNKLLNNAGLNLNVEGSYLEGTAVVISQSVGHGEKVSRGTIITVEFRYYDVADGYR